MAWYLAWLLRIGQQLSNRAVLAHVVGQLSQLTPRFFPDLLQRVNRHMRRGTALPSHDGQISVDLVALANVGFIGRYAQRRHIAPWRDHDSDPTTRRRV